MSKVISPIVFRSKYFNSYINKQFLYFNKKSNNISYFKFFNIYINLLYLVKKNLNLINSYILSKYLFTKVEFINIKIIVINFIFSRIYNKKVINIIKNLFLNITLYFNYFKNYKFYGKIKNFFILKLSNLTYYNLIEPLSSLKFTFYDYKKFKKSIIFYCNKVFKFKYKKRFNVIGIKFICSGRFNKLNNRSKVDIYSIGSLYMQTITSKFYYFTDSINTDKGVIGLKIWINVN